MLHGWLHGEITPTTPSGSRVTDERLPLSSSCGVGRSSGARIRSALGRDPGAGVDGRQHLRRVRLADRLALLARDQAAEGVGLVDQEAAGAAADRRRGRRVAAEPRSGCTGGDLVDDALDRVGRRAATAPMRSPVAGLCERSSMASALAILSGTGRRAVRSRAQPARAADPRQPLAERRLGVVGLVEAGVDVVGQQALGPDVARAGRAGTRSRARARRGRARARRRAAGTAAARSRRGGARSRAPARSPRSRRWTSARARGRSPPARGSSCASGRPDVLDRLGGGDRDDERLRVGVPDVLGREDHHPPRDEPRVLAALEHDREIEQRCVGIGPPRRLDPGRRHVVVTIRGAVVADRRPRDRLPGMLVVSRSPRPSAARAPGSTARRARRRRRGPRSGRARRARALPARAGSRSPSSARSSSARTSSSASGSSTYSCVRDSSASLTSNAGFSVVAPIRVTSPSSTAGSSASCCALLNRWISSRKKIVGPARGRAPLAGALDHRAHLAAGRCSPRWPPRTRRRWRSATMRASVVLPLPGGPCRIIECRRPVSIATRSGAPAASSVRWPTRSSIARGRIRTASGASGGAARVAVALVAGAPARTASPSGQYRDAVGHRRVRPAAG